jgi:multiple antibiotic resistance protein
MPSSLTFGLAAFGSIFSIVDPFAALPVYLALTGRETEASRRRIATRAALTCLLVLCTFALIGPAVFRFFGITIPAFRIAGGLLLFGVSMEMMHAKISETKTTAAEKEDAAGKDDVGLIPVGIPLLSGPGAIASVMMLAGSASGTSERAALFTAIILVASIAWVLLRFAGRVARFFGTTGMNLIGRIMGLILAAVAVQFILDGLQGAFPRLFA